MNPWDGIREWSGIALAAIMALAGALTAWAGFVAGRERTKIQVKSLSDQIDRLDRRVSELERETHAAGGLLGRLDERTDAILRGQEVMQNALESVQRSLVSRG